MSLEFLFMVLGGKVVLYAFQSLTSNLTIKSNFIQKLIGCDFCLGCWLYMGLVWAFGMGAETGQSAIPLVDVVLWGIGISFAVHLISLGWKTKFETIVIE